MLTNKTSLAEAEQLARDYLAERDAKIRRLREQGLHQHVIASRLGVSEGTVRRILNAQKA